MNQIYNFESQQPPILNESMLQEEIKKRQLRRQTTLAAIAGVLTQICLLLGTILLADRFPVLSLICAVYTIISVTGSTVIAILINSRMVKRALYHA